MSTQRPTGQRESSQQHKNGQREKKGRKLREKVSFETNYLQVYN